MVKAFMPYPECRGFEGFLSVLRKITPHRIFLSYMRGIMSEVGQSSTDSNRCNE